MNPNETGREVGDASTSVALRDFRHWLLTTSAATTVLWVVSLLLATILEGSWSLLLSVIGTALFLTASACILAWMMAPSYSADVADLEPLSIALGYAVRASAYGIAGAGAGMLLAEAIPRRLLLEAAFLQSMTVQGIVVVAFGTTGAALGFLEEWRRRHPSASPGAMHGAVGRIERSDIKEVPVHEDPSLKAIDRWVIGAVVTIAIALIAASVLRPEAIGTYASALGGVGAVSVAYFAFGR
jgi:hypothetical protein